MPRVSLSGGANASGTDYGADEDEWYAQLSLHMRIYDVQLGTNLDVLDARAALTESLTAYVNAVYDIAAAQSALIFVVGWDAP
jgi:outer membrane protein TolC